jgi:hypothetical protein
MSKVTVKFYSILAACCILAPFAWAHLQTAAQIVA